MPKRTITRADLSDAVYRTVGLSRSEAADLVDVTLAEIADAIVRGEMVKLTSFGMFCVRQKGPRIGRNPKTLVEATIPARRVVLFRPARRLKAAVNADDCNKSGNRTSAGCVFCEMSARLA